MESSQLAKFKMKSSPVLKRKPREELYFDNAWNYIFRKRGLKIRSRAMPSRENARPVMNMRISGCSAR
jgi:hypothetical protein